MWAKQQRAEREGRFYPYLSVDPKNNPPAHHDIPNCESLDYLHVKFDTKRELRESYFRNFRKRLTSKMFEVITDPSYKQEGGYDERKAAKKTLLNPEQLIRPPAFKSIRETAILPHRQSSHPRRSIPLEESTHPGEGSGAPKPKCFTFNHLSTSQEEQKSVKRKKNLYQKMLKKVDQLREIYKYETELMNITELRDQPPIRFHTEPIYLDFAPKDLQHKPNRKKELMQQCPRKISPQNRSGLFRTDGHQATGERTLDVRKYRNDTSMKKRMKYLLRKQLIRQEYTLSDQKTPSHQNTLKDSKRTKGNDREAVGPWDAEQSTFFLREE